MSNLKNSVQLIGNLGKDPEVKQTESGRSYAKMTIATNDIYTNAQGQKVTDTEWHNLIAWGKTAENMGKILRKGNHVVVRGKLSHSNYQDETGQTRYFSTVVVNEFMVLNKVERPA